MAEKELIRGDEKSGKKRTCLPLLLHGAGRMERGQKGLQAQARMASATTRLGSWEGEEKRTNARHPFSMLIRDEPPLKPPDPPLSPTSHPVVQGLLHH